MEKSYTTPPIVWLKVTDYMHGWLEWELGGAIRVNGLKVISLQHLKGARAILRGMETAVDTMDTKSPVGNSMSAKWKNCIDVGVEMCPETEKMYGVTKKQLKLFVPLECPTLCLTSLGVVRPWTDMVNLGKKQATALQCFLREEFWAAVADFDKAYARKMGGRKYPAVGMIEDFCVTTGTPDLYVEAMRREWQRRVKRVKSEELTS